MIAPRLFDRNGASPETICQLRKRGLSQRGTAKSCAGRVVNLDNSCFSSFFVFLSLRRAFKSPATTTTTAAATAGRSALPERDPAFLLPRPRRLLLLAARAARRYHKLWRPLGADPHSGARSRCERSRFRNSLAQLFCFCFKQFDYHSLSVQVRHN